MRRIERDNTGLLRPGQDLVAAGFAGLRGSLLAARARKNQLAQWFSQEYLEEIENLAALEIRTEQVDWQGAFGALEWEAAGEGGILAAVWRLSGAYETGVEFSLRSIPIRQETIEICERLELNPFRLYSRGCVLLAGENGGRMAERLRREGIPAGVIGQVKEGIVREMIVESGRSFLERPQQDELLKIIPDFHQGGRVPVWREDLG